MLRRLLLIAVLAGAAAGLVATGIQAARLWPLILEAEKYEHAGEAHAHPPVSAPAAAPAAPAAAHEHEWEPAEGAERMAYTVLFNLLAGFGFALLLNGAMALRAATSGTPPPGNAVHGALWGLAGFACFAFAPAFGLPPLLPGAEGAALFDRQLWWAATAVATAVGLGLVAFAPRPTLKVLGAVLLLAPHLVGAPRPDAPGGGVPATLAAEFAVASLVAAAAFWLVLGAISGWLQRRLA